MPMPQFTPCKALRWILALLFLPAWLLVFWTFFYTESVLPRASAALPTDWQRVSCSSNDVRAFVT
jgi:hypothetical protein